MRFQQAEKKDVIPMRTFLAVQLPNDLKEKLMQIIRQLGPYRLQGHFSTEENLHLTLEFIGETTKIAAIKQAMQQIEQSSFSIQPSSLGTFHREGKEILWVGFQKSKELTLLQQTLCKKLKEQGFSLQERRFVPHLTLGRELVFSDFFSIGSFSEKTARPLLENCSVPIEKISLMKSERKNGKLVYTEIAFVGLNNI